MCVVCLNNRTPLMQENPPVCRDCLPKIPRHNLDRMNTLYHMFTEEVAFINHVEIAGVENPCPSGGCARCR